MTHEVVVRDLAVEVPGRRLFGGLSFRVPAGSVLAVVAPSGTGKTSLLNCVAGLTRPVEGSVEIADESVWDLTDAKRTAFRLRNIGMVFQFAELIPELTLRENAALPLRLLGASRAEAERRAQARICDLGIADQATLHPSAVSGGEAQRAGIARALVHRPSVLLADEPTGALDQASARTVADLLTRTARASGAAVIVGTHDPSIAAIADAVIDLRSVAPAPAPPGSAP